MADQYLKDPQGNLLGRIKTQYDGKLELHDRTGSIRGSYNPKTNETRDRFNKLVGRGNILVRLL